MCEANVYMEKDGELEVLMENVASITPLEDRLLLVDLFGEQKRVKAELKELRLLDHKVILAPTEAPTE
ncbi:MAG: CooT family nickel-binding protein [Actinobacteria bacterium]|nr:CooT family nickel-binding protein [Actinomycetota bacterium]